MNKKNKKSTLNILKSGQNLKLATKLKSNLLKLEFILVLFALLGYILKNIVLISVSLLLLSVIYFIMYFAKYKKHSEINETISTLFLFISCGGKAVSIIVILYLIINKPYPKIMLISGIILLTSSLFLILYYIIKGTKDEIFSITTFIRNLIIISVMLFFLFQFKFL